MKKILSIMGINAFIAAKVKYNSSVGCNGFYAMLRRRMAYSKPKETCYFLKHELHYHWKEVSQYQN